MKSFHCDTFEVQYICPSCQYLFGSEIPTHCASCNGTPGDMENLIKSGSVFIKLSISDQLRGKFQDTDFCQSLNYKWSRTKRNSQNVEDIFDGTMYKSIDALNDPKLANISVSWNVDGVPIFKSSPFHIWPLQVTINELPPNLRAKHVILGGLWFGPKKPEMNLFLQSFVDELRSLENQGLPCQWKGEKAVVHVYSLLCICDSVARCAVQNVKQFNGEHGCNWCYQKGEVVEKGNGFTRVYPLQSTGPELRSHRKHTEDAQQAVGSGTCINGVKGPSPLMLLMFFNMVSGFAYDYMHGILLGVCRQLTTLWFDSKYHTEPWYIGRENEQIERRLLAIKPPTSITRPPRSISLRKYWKASEYRHFLLFYSLPCLFGILPRQYLDHLLLLVQATYILLQDSISPHDIDKADGLLKAFVGRFESQYGKSHVSYNVHILVHAAASVKNWGPLWSHSAFLYESQNGHLQKLFHGTQAVAEQIVNMFNLYQHVPRLIAAVFNDEQTQQSKSFVEKMLGGTSIVTKCIGSSSVMFLGCPHVRQPTPRESHILQESGFSANKAFSFYSRAVVNGKRIHSKGAKSLSKRINHAVQTKHGSIALVRSFIDVGNAQGEGHAFIDVMKTTSNDISKDRESGITAKSILKERGIDSVELIKCTDIHSTCVYLKDLPGLANNFFCIQPNRWELD